MGVNEARRTTRGLSDAHAPFKSVAYVATYAIREVNATGHTGNLPLRVVAT